MLDPSVLPGFLMAIVLVCVAPGPDNAYIAAVAIHRGARAGVLSALGMALGMVVHVTAAALGLALVLRAAPGALDAVRLAGAAYLAVLAVSTLRAARHGESSRARVEPDGGVVTRAVIINLTNPKVIIFFAAFLPHFVRAGFGPTSLQLLSLGLVFLLIGLVVDCSVGVAAGRLGAVLGPGGRAGTSLSVIAGLTFAVLAVLLVLDVVGRWAASMPAVGLAS